MISNAAKQVNWTMILFSVQFEIFLVCFDAPPFDVSFWCRRFLQFKRKNRLFHKCCTEHISGLICFIYIFWNRNVYDHLNDTKSRIDFFYSNGIIQRWVYAHIFCHWFDWKLTFEDCMYLLQCVLRQSFLKSVIFQMDSSKITFMHLIFMFTAFGSSILKPHLRVKRKKIKIELESCINQKFRLNDLNLIFVHALQVQTNSFRENFQPEWKKLSKFNLDWWRWG